MNSVPRSVRFVLATIIIDAIGFGIIMPVMPDLLMDVGNMDVASAARFGGLLALLYAGFQFLLGPVLGNLADRYGRRPILLGSLVGYSANFALMTVAPNLGWLVLGQALAGIFGGTYAPAQAALADITAPADRARIFGYVGAAFGIGFTIGPAIGGLLGELGPRTPFAAAAILAAINFLYGLRFFPETLEPENRRAFDWRRGNPFGALKTLGRLQGILPLGLVLLLWQVASLVYPLTWSYYLIAGFDASPRMIGVSLTIVGITFALVQFFLTGRIVAHFGERRTAIIGLCAASTAFAAFAVAPHFPIAMLTALIMPFGSIIQPSLSAMVSQRGSANNQGEIQGFTASVMSLGAMIAPITLNPTIAHFTAADAPMRLPGAAFVLATVIALTALAILLQMRPKVSGNQARDAADNLISH
jgi:MFS transporter, DHA1 family, tetracycline resistance protein